MKYSTCNLCTVGGGNSGTSSLGWHMRSTRPGVTYTRAWRRHINYSMICLPKNVAMGSTVVKKGGRQDTTISSLEAKTGGRMENIVSTENRNAELSLKTESSAPKREKEENLDTVSTTLDSLQSGSEALRSLLERRKLRRESGALTKEGLDQRGTKENEDSGKRVNDSLKSSSVSKVASQAIRLPKDMPSHGFFAASSEESPVALRSGSSIETATPSLAKIVFWIHLHINYGERLFVVGSVPELGNWILSNGAPMSWTDGDMWQAEVEIPAGGIVEYKYVIVNQNGDALSWQAGNNSVLAISRTDERLDVYDNWYGNPGAQVSSPGLKPVTRENRLLAWASELELTMDRQRQELRRVRMELASAQEETRIARQEAREAKSALAVAEAERAAAISAQRHSEARNRILQAQLEETTASFKTAIETAISLIENGSTTSNGKKPRKTRKSTSKSSKAEEKLA